MQGNKKNHQNNFPLPHVSNSHSRLVEKQIDHHPLKALYVKPSHNLERLKAKYEFKLLDLF